MLTDSIVCHAGADLIRSLLDVHIAAIGKHSWILLLVRNMDRHARRIVVVIHTSIIQSVLIL
jgi:hypothetical protein